MLLEKQHSATSISALKKVWHRVFYHYYYHYCYYYFVSCENPTICVKTLGHQQVTLFPLFTVGHLCVTRCSCVNVMWNLNFECVAVLWRFYFLCNLLSTPHPQSHPTPLCPLWEWVHVWDEGSLKGFPLHCSSNSRLGLCGEAIQPLCWKPAGFCVYFCVCMCVCFAVVWHPLPTPSLPGIQPKLLLSSPFSLLMSLPILWLTSPLP